MNLGNTVPLCILAIILHLGYPLSTLESKLEIVINNGINQIMTDFTMFCQFIDAYLLFLSNKLIQGGFSTAFDHLCNFHNSFFFF